MIAQNGILTVHLDPEAIQSLLESGDVIGLVATSALEDRHSAFATMEAAGSGSAAAPALVITYVPEPGAVGLAIGAGGLALLMRRRRAADRGRAAPPPPRL